MPVNPPTYFLISYAISKNTKGKKIGHKEFLWIAPAPIMNQWCHMVFQLIVKFVKALQCSMANSGPYISICIGTYNVVQKEEDGKRPSGRLGMACSYIYMYICVEPLRQHTQVRIRWQSILCWWGISETALSSSSWTRKRC